MIPDIIDPSRCRAGSRIRSVAGPGLVRLGWMVEGPDHPFDDVIDIGKVSPHLSVVVDLDRLSFQNRFCENEERHVGPPPGPIDRKKPQTSAGDSIAVSYTH